MDPSAPTLLNARAVLEYELGDFGQVELYMQRLLDEPALFAVTAILDAKS